jgi:hypothetical protein
MFGRLIVIAGIALFAAAPQAVLADGFEDGSVQRGTPAESVRVQLGEPIEIQASSGDGLPWGDGVRVEKWLYSEGLVVVVQEGFVIDSFIQKKSSQ